MPLPAAAVRGYGLAMTQVHDETEPQPVAPSRAGILMLCGGALGLLGAGLLLWWREGDRLFTDGLIASIVACF